MSNDADRFSSAPISQLIGFEVQPAQALDSYTGEATVKLHCGQQHHNPMGRVHGGVVSALADAAMGIAFGRTLLDTEDFSTIEMKVNFLRPIKAGLLVANATIVERGMRIGFVQCEIVNERGKRIATGTCTCTVIST